MNGKQLKNSILQWAIQGKLVPQDPNDEPASVLLDRIRAEKARLVKEGKIKKDKNESIIYRGDDNSHYEKFIDGTIKCIDKEIPFEIPESWIWVRIENVFQINPKNKAEDNGEAAFIPMELIDATFFSSFSFVTRKWKEIKNGFTHFADGDIAFAKITPCFQNRKSMILHDLPNGIGAGTTELKVLRPYAKTINEFYLLFFLESSYFVEQAVFKGTANQQRIVSRYLENKLFPLPPANEQKRIVELVKSLLTLAEEYGKSQIALNNLNEELPKRIKQSILQEAIQGRLVTQDSNDEPVEELLKRIRQEKERLVVEDKLKRKDIVDSIIFRGDDNKYYEQIGCKCLEISDEIPFSIPDSWTWFRFGEYVKMKIGKTPARGETAYWSDGAYPWVSISDMSDYGRVAETKEKVSEEAAQRQFGEISPIGTLLMSFKLTVGRTSILEIAAYHNEAIISIFPYLDESSITRDYLFYVLPLISNLGDSKDAIKGKTLNSLCLYKMLLPVPPLHEQKRIVERIQELYSKL